MTYAKAIEFLYSLQVFGARFGLDNARRLAALAGHPEAGLQFVHVAGTNGKGSTCAMIESIHRAAGLRVGLFTSPHLVSFAERIQVNRKMISPDDVARLVGDVQGAFGEFAEDSPPTFFEVLTVLALRYFSEQGCDLVVWETGLGGRLDATNIVTPLVSVITNIGLDHQQWLGESFDQIATEKAGIIKPGVPVVTAAEPGRGLEVIARIAHENDSLLTVVDQNDARGGLLDAARIPLLGQHQRLNGAVAVAAVRALESKFPVSQEAILLGLSSVKWPGRLQRARTAGGQQVVLDGAHNQASAEALAVAFRAHFPTARTTLVIGILADKDWRAMVETLVPLASRVILVPVSSSRTLHPDELVSACRAANPAAVVETSDSLADALRRCASNPLLLITGSLYLIGEAMERLGLSTAPGADERGLNDWLPKG